MERPLFMATSAMPTRDDFAALLDESLGESTSFEGRVVKGIVTAIENDAASLDVHLQSQGRVSLCEFAAHGQKATLAVGDADEYFVARQGHARGGVKRLVTASENDVALIDVGLKSEGRVSLREFAAPGQKAELAVGDEVEVFVDRVENAQGEAMLSRDRARREAAWDTLEKQFETQERVEGVIFGRVKGGFTVDLSGAVAFLPGSQVDIRPVRDVTPLMGIPQPFQLLKMDRRRGNIVVSRRAVLEETRAEQRSGLIQSLHEGQVIDGVVKNITDYGAFVDLGGIDGLLHVTDMS